MKTFELKRKVMVNLTIMVLFAFSLYPSTEGNNIEAKGSFADSLNILEELQTFNHCLSKSRMDTQVKSCILSVVDASSGFATEEECKKAYKLAGKCIAKDLDTCGVHPRLRAAFIIQFNRSVSTKTCLEIAENRKTWGV